MADLNLDTLNVLPDSNTTYNQIVSEIINKTNTNNAKIESGLDDIIIDGGTF